MDLIVDHARQETEPSGVNYFIHLDLRCRIDVGDNTTIQENIHGLGVVRQYHRCALDQSFHLRTQLRRVGFQLI